MYWRSLVFSFLVVIILLPSAGRAAPEVEGESAIVAVRVFPDRAEVVRSIEAALPAGHSALVVKNLPANLIAQSVRVRGAADASLRIGSVETKRHFEEAVVRAEERRLLAELEALQDQRRALDDRIAGARVQLDFVGAIGREGPKLLNQQMAEGRFDPEALGQALGLLGRGAAEAYEAIRSAEIDKRALEPKINRTQQRLNQVRTGRTASLVARINLETDRPARARLELSYQLPGASWRPLYDARLDSESGKTRLVQIGEVRQGTGEDWSNVRLTLSTARPAVSARLPELGTWFIDFVDLGAYDNRKSDRPKAESELSAPRDASSLNRSLERPAGSLDEAMAVTGGAARSAEPVTAQVVAGEFAAAYRIPGEAKVPSDNQPHKFVISERPFAAELAVHSVPKIAPQAYLTAEIAYDGEEPLLPGPVSVFRDGAFVGSSAMPMLRPGEDVKLSFGVDDKVRIDYRLETGQRSSEGLINKHQRLERRYLIEVTNHHARPMEITVLDQLPVPQDERIEVELLRTTTQVSERDLEKRKGVLAWRATYEPGETRTIRFGYAVTYPEGQAVPAF
jgi:uncharacterized protein (TIGR02231 family)